MITDNYTKMMSESMVDYRRQQDGERGNSMFQIDSALPSVEGLELRSDPAYIAYYRSNVGLNPRLPPPFLSKDECSFAHCLPLGDKTKLDDESLFSNDNEWRRGDGLIGWCGLGLGNNQKNVADMIQDGMSHTTSTSRHSSRPSSRAFDDVVDPSESQFAHLPHELASLDALRSQAKVQGTSALQKVDTSGSQSYASALGGSLSQSTTSDPQLVARPSPRIPSAGGGRISSLDKRNLDAPNTSENISSNVGVHADLLTAFSGMGLSVNGMGDERKYQNAQIHDEIDYHQNLFQLQKDQNAMKQHSYSNKSESVQFHKSACCSAPSYLKGLSTPTLSSGGSSPSQYPTVDSPNSMFSPYVLGGYGMKPSSPPMLENQLGGGNFPSVFENIVAGAAMGACGIDPRAIGGGLNLGPNLLAVAAELQNINRVGNQTSGGSLQLRQMDPMHRQYLRSTEYLAAQLSAVNDPTVNRESLGNSYMDLLELQKAYIGELLASQNSQYGFSCLGKSGGFSNGYYGNLALGVNMSYPGSPLASAALQNLPFGPGSPVRYGERNIHCSLGMRNLPGVMGAWHSDSGSNMGERFASSLLDEFKSNKSRYFELSEIEGHVVEFSADQYGSRFIQQKLETATTEEKNMVFREIMPQALSLMTDVFGNYVIQKFFEHGSASQIRELADQLNGHVLTLSLQMYGCRVIQKHILEHGKPEERTSIINKLMGQIVQMSQQKFASNVVEKCLTFGTPEERQTMVDEILGSEDENGPLQVMMKDQFANYVVQKVLETCDDQQLALILNRIKVHLNALKKYTYGKHIVARVEKLVAAGERRISFLASYSA